MSGETVALLRLLAHGLEAVQGGLQALVVAVDGRHEQLTHHVEHVGEALVEAPVLLHRLHQLGDLGLEALDPPERGGTQQLPHGRVHLTTRRQGIGSSLPTGASPRLSTRSTTVPPRASISSTIRSGSAYVRWCLPKNVGSRGLTGGRNSRKVRPPRRPAIAQNRQSPWRPVGASASISPRA